MIIYNTRRVIRGRILSRLQLEIDCFRQRVDAKGHWEQYPSGYMLWIPRYDAEEYQ